MNKGYLFIEVSPSHPGLIRLGEKNRLPQTGTSINSDPCIIYVAQFDDIEAAAMHCHELLKFHLFDLNSRLYRTDPVKAVAAIEADSLNHRPVFLHPDMDQISSLNLDQEVANIMDEQERTERRWKTIGKVAVGILVTELIIAI